MRNYFIDLEHFFVIFFADYSNYDVYEVIGEEEHRKISIRVLQVNARGKTLEKKACEIFLIFDFFLIFLLIFSTKCTWFLLVLYPSGKWLCYNNCSGWTHASPKTKLGITVKNYDFLISRCPETFYKYVH